jgi:hypothetical protein
MESLEHVPTVHMATRFFRTLCATTCSATNDGHVALCDATTSAQVVTPVVNCDGQGPPRQASRVCVHTISSKYGCLMTSKCKTIDRAGQIFLLTKGCNLFPGRRSRDRMEQTVNCSGAEDEVIGFDPRPIQRRAVVVLPCATMIEKCIHAGWLLLCMSSSMRRH